jgi:hypothetical protein
MICLGFKYEVRKKGYYIDGHEKTAKTQYRNQFCKPYLTYERHAHHLIQLSLDESRKLEESGKVGNEGYWNY